MDGVKFIRSKLTGVNFIDGTVLSNIDFQECEGMEGMSFQGLNSQGARMIGLPIPVSMLVILEMLTYVVYNLTSTNLLVISLVLI